MTMRIGYGNDIHRLVERRPLIIGGITIASDLGADGHSDGDVLLHAITDAVLGALALGDIGSHFPNSDERWRGAESSKFLAYAAGLIREQGYRIENIDSTVSLETPKLSHFIHDMRLGIAAAVGIDLEQVSVKAKSGEGMDAVGESRAIQADAVVLIVKA